MTGHLDVVGRVSGPRRWSDAEKLDILAKAFRPGVRVCDVIARREVSSSLIYTWRKQLRDVSRRIYLQKMDLPRKSGEFP